MVLSEEDDPSVERRFKEICADLNMDRTAAMDSWQNYLRISQHYTLEGEPLHWLACALYVACRNSSVPTVGRPGAVVDGNCVSLTRLLRCCRLSLLQFFSKMKNWADMASLPQEFRTKIERLERNFAVSRVIFNKFEPIFMDIFNAPSNETPRPRNRKQKRQPCTSSDIFAFCWTLFVQVKGNFPAISDDLVNSYHLLLSCMDLIYANVIISDRRDLLNKNFSGLPENFNDKDYRPVADPPCIIQVLCNKHDGLAVEAKGIKEHWWKPHIKKLFDKKILKGKVDVLSGLLDLGNFEVNSKAVNTAYEIFVLNVGDFDERIFLERNGGANEIGTSARYSLTPNANGLLECLQMDRSPRNLESANPLAPQTPLTGRRYLTGREFGNVTPVSTATQSVSRLQALLCGRKTCPSDALLEIFKNCNKDPTDYITNLIKSLGETFCTFYAQPSDEHPGSHVDFAKKRLQLGESLYYKALESILAAEKKRLNSKTDFSPILDCDQFHRSLFACCLEIVIFSYNSQRIFPWVLEVLNIEPYHFYKVIEIFIRAEDSLSRDVVKHLNHIEEQILESLAWKSDSPLWDAVKEAGNTVPSCEDVCLSTQGEVQLGVSHQQLTTSPVPHPALRRLALDKSLVKSPQSPLSMSSLSERYNSSTSNGTVSTAKRRLFSSNSIPVAISRPLTSTTSQNSSTQTQLGETVLLTTTGGTTVPLLTSQKSVTIVQAQNDGGFIAYAPAQFVAIPLATGASIAGVSPSPTRAAEASPISKPKKGGSLGLFFRKFYHMTSVRLRDLCDRLEIKDEDVRKKIWTCFENSMITNPDLMLDRHVDQLIMCAVYVMSKVTGINTKFTDIMKCYRMQPQAISHVYRSVLLTSKKRHSSSGSSSSSADGSKQAPSESSSPVPMEKEDDKEKDDKRNLRLAIRSSSTLPVDHQSNSQPPTPTRLAGASNSFEFEDRGDVIAFYNKVYVARMQQFVLKFSSDKRNTSVVSPPLSPLPLPKNFNMSPRRKVSSNHSVFISPLKCSPSPSRPLSYSFSKSPAKDLRAINNMVRLGGECKIGKRILQDDGDSESSLAKRGCLDSTFRKIQSVITERQGTTTAN